MISSSAVNSFLWFMNYNGISLSMKNVYINLPASFVRSTSLQNEHNTRCLDEIYSNKAFLHWLERNPIEAFLLLFFFFIGWRKERKKMIKVCIISYETREREKEFIELPRDPAIYENVHILTVFLLLCCCNVEKFLSGKIIFTTSQLKKQQKRRTRNFAFLEMLSSSSSVVLEDSWSSRDPFAMSGICLKFENSQQKFDDELLVFAPQLGKQANERNKKKYLEINLSARADCTMFASSSSSFSSSSVILYVGG